MTHEPDFVKCTMIIQIPGIVVFLSWTGLPVNHLLYYTMHVLLTIERELLSWVQILQLVQMGRHEGIINRRALNLYVQR